MQKGCLSISGLYKPQFKWGCWRTLWQSPSMKAFMLSRSVVHTDGNRSLCVKNVTRALVRVSNQSLHDVGVIVRLSLSGFFWLLQCWNGVGVGVSDAAQQSDKQVVCSMLALLYVLVKGVYILPYWKFNFWKIMLKASVSAFQPFKSVGNTFLVLPKSELVIWCKCK